MYDEEKRKGSGTFYAVIGVATLVVAIIGATFAYFSASKTEADVITGQTNNVQSNLTLTVDRVKFEGTTAESDDLVPANFGQEPNAITTTEVNRALSAKCEEGGFTGCHIWKITAKSTQKLDKASIYLDLKVGEEQAKEDTDWSYAVFKSSNETTSNGEEHTVKATELSASSVEEQGSFNNISGSGTDIHQTAGISKNQDVTYYVMIYLKDNDDQTEEYTSEGKNNYTGSVTLQAAGTGQVKASFTAE